MTAGRYINVNKVLNFHEIFSLNFHAPAQPNFRNRDKSSCAELEHLQKFKVFGLTYPLTFQGLFTTLLSLQFVLFSSFSALKK